MKKRYKRIKNVILNQLVLGVLLSTLFSCKPEPVEVYSLTIDSPNLWLNIGDTRTLTATIQTNMGKNENVIWVSNDINIVKVNHQTGEITALKNGVTVITAYAEADISIMATCTVTVCQRNIYIVGTRYAEGVPPEAIWWENGEAKVFSSSSEAYDFAFKEDHVYIAGILHLNDMQYAALWIDGFLQLLSEENSETHALYIDGEDVYVAGAINGYATIWKNGVAETRSEKGCFYDIQVLGNDVYVVGTFYVENEEMDPYIALLKNEENMMEYIVWGEGRALFVSENEVIVAGASDNKPIIWKNGWEECEGNYSFGIVHSIAVSEHGIYLAGRLGFSPCLWFNDIATQLSSEYIGAAESVFVMGEDYFVVGEQLWTSLHKNSIDLDFRGYSIIATHRP